MRSSSTALKRAGVRILATFVAEACEVFDKAREGEAQGFLVVPEWLGSMMAREIKYYEQLELVVRWPGGQEIR